VLHSNNRARREKVSPNFANPYSGGEIAIGQWLTSKWRAQPAGFTLRFLCGIREGNGAESREQNGSGLRLDCRKNGDTLF